MLFRSITRPLILAQLQEIVKNEIDLINDKDTLREMLNFVVNKNGRAEAEQGYHDDLVMALAIAYYIRPQQEMKLFKTAQDEVEDFLNKEFDLEDGYVQDDYGSSIDVF